MQVHFRDKLSGILLQTRFPLLENPLRFEERGNSGSFHKGVFWKGKGRIKESSGLLLERPITVKSTPSQDRKMLEMLREEALHPPFYNGVLHQCVFWSVGALQYGMQEKGTDDCCHK